MTPIQKQIHDQALVAAANYKRAEWPVIFALQEAQRNNVFAQAGCRNAFIYTCTKLGLTEAVAYAFSAVAKKALELPSLNEALRQHRFMVQKVARITSVLNKENLDELMDFMDHCTYRELDERRAKLDPKKKRRTSKKPVREGWVRFATDLSKRTLAEIERAMVLRSKKKGLDEDAIINEVFGEWLDRHDPIRKAERAATKSRTTACVHKRKPIRRRTPLTAPEKHEVNRRDKGQCVFVNENGERCKETRWTHHHHVVEVSKGGTNHPSNIRTLCAFHHDLVHQLSFPIEAQFNWIYPPAPDH